MSTPLQPDAEPLSAVQRAAPIATHWKAAGVSVTCHLLLLIGLGLVTLADQSNLVSDLSSVLFDDPAEERFLPEFPQQESEKIGNGGDSEFASAFGAASATISDGPRQDIERTIDSAVRVTAPTTNDLPTPSRSDVLKTVATLGTTEHAGGVDGAIDRLALEIANSLREKKTLVVWLFDISPSLTARREQIANRVALIYRQLTDLNVVADSALMSAVAVYGETCTIKTPKPLSDTVDLIDLVRSIKSDQSGNENSCSAVMKVAKQFLPFRTEMHRDVMLVLVTDEDASDLENLDQAITYCKRYGMRCYCVGDAAPFGRKTIETPFVTDNGEQVIGVMQKGPESYYAELLRLGYWGTGGHDLEEIPSGFGPYGLTRLCTETNGLYFIADEVRSRHAFDPAVLRNYTPDYRPVAVIDREIQKNQAKLALVESCLAVEREAQNRKVLNIAMPRLEFRAESDTVLRRELSDSQKPIADLDASLDHLLHRLEQGVKDRSRIQEARWRASYDLAIGRTLALRVRAFGYNSMLAEMKSHPKTFQSPEGNLWRLIPSSEITSGMAVKKLASQANDYLTRVIQDHPGTPWSLLAERERSVPMGWEWKEGHYETAASAAAKRQKMGPKFLDDEKSKSNSGPKKPPTPPQRRDI